MIFQKITFNTIENRYSVVRGIVSPNDTTINIENLKTTIVAERTDVVAFYKKNKDKDTLITEIRRVIRASVGNRAKENLVVDFINETDLDNIQNKANIIDSFFYYAQRKQKEEALELIAEENLSVEEAKRYITSSLKREYASENGTELNALLPKMSPLNPQYLTKKQIVFQKLVSFVEKFKGVGGNI